jgi:hypothetical protein
MELNPPILRIAAAGIALALAAGGCGDRGSSASTATTTTAPQLTTPAPQLKSDQDVARICPEISRRAAAVIGGLTGHPPSLSPERLRATNFSSCRLSAHDVAVRMTLDTAAKVRKRYDNRIVESQQFSSQTPGLFPQPVQGVGDRHASGGGANWLAVFNQLLSIRGAHMLAMTFYVKGVSDRDLEGAAKQVALATWDLLGVPRR